MSNAQRITRLPRPRGLAMTPCRHSGATRGSSFRRKPRLVIPAQAAARHSGASPGSSFRRKPESRTAKHKTTWTPAFAGVTKCEACAGVTPFTNHDTCTRVTKCEAYAGVTPFTHHEPRTNHGPYDTCAIWPGLHGRMNQGKILMQRRTYRGNPLGSDS